MIESIIALSWWVVPALIVIGCIITLVADPVYLTVTGSLGKILLISACVVFIIKLTNLIMT